MKTFILVAAILGSFAMFAVTQDELPPAEKKSAMMLDCPMEVKGADLVLADTNAGIALMITTTSSDVSELRRRAANMAKMHSNTSEAPTVHADMMPFTVQYEDIPDGTRLTLTPQKTEQLQEFRQNVRRHAEQMSKDGCGMMHKMMGGVMSFDIPIVMKAEHGELHSALAELTQSGGRTGQAAKAVAVVLEEHFIKENEYALPPLSLLPALSKGEFDCKMTEVLTMTNKLEAEMPLMLSEHREIVAALKKLNDAATAEAKPAGVEFTEHLTAHAQEEEEITYPTALLVGRYVRLRAAQCPH